MSNNTKIYQFKVCLKEISSMIWRRFLIQSDNVLKDLHYVIQILMGWTNYHLNEFITKGWRYTIPNMIGHPSVCRKYGSNIKLEEFKFRKNEKFLYTLIQSGKYTVADLAKMAKISRQTLHNWKMDFEAST